MNQKYRMELAFARLHPTNNKKHHKQKYSMELAFTETIMDEESIIFPAIKDITILVLLFQTVRP